MSLNIEPSSSRRIPLLVQYCQRVASAHVDNICSLGEDIRLELVKPILQNCLAETLLRLEQATPPLANETCEMWKALCLRTFPLQVEHRYTEEEPESWRDEYFVLNTLEKKRLEEVGSKLRSQREAMEQRKKDSQIKYTDKLPPAKRGRTQTWVPTQPKTLFQKTRSDAAKMQKGIYGARVPMPPTKTFRPLPNVPSAKIFKPFSSPSTSTSTSSLGTSGSRVTVAAIPVAREALKPTSPASPETPVRPLSGLKPARKTHTSGEVPSVTPVTQSTLPPISTPPTPNKPPPARKDLMTSLFMPKHRAYSQLPTQSTGIRPRA